MCCSGDYRAFAPGVFDNSYCKGRSLYGIRAGAQFIEQEKIAFTALLEHAYDIRHM